MMKKTLPLTLIYLLLSFALPATVVIAATPTPLATETVAPTITPYNPNNQCLATSIIPTIDRDLFSTPTPQTFTPEPTATCPPGYICGHSEGGGLASATPTITVTPTATLALMGLKVTGINQTLQGGGPYSGSNVFYSSSVNSVVNEFYASTYVWGNTGGGGDYKKYDTGYSFQNTSSNILRVYIAVSARWAGTPASGQKYRLDDVNGGRAGVYSYYSTSVPSVDYVFYEDIPANNTYTYYTNANIWDWYANQQNYSIYTSFHIAVFSIQSAFTPVPSPTPTVTVTPVPTIDCGVGNPTDGYQPSNIPFASFNPPVIRPGACYTVFDPIALPLPELSWAPFSLPSDVSFAGWQICVNMVSMSAKLGGIEWVGVLGAIVTFLAGGGIYVTLKSQ